MGFLPRPSLGLSVAAPHPRRRRTVATVLIERRYLDPAEDGKRTDKRDAKGTPEGRTEKGQPAEVDEGAPQQRDEQPVAAGGLDGEDAAAWRSAGGAQLPHGHRRQHEAN